MKAYLLTRLILAVNAGYLAIYVSAPAFLEAAPVKKRKAEITSVREISKDKSLVTNMKKDIKVVRFPAVDSKNKPVKAKYHFYIQGGLHGNEILTSKFVLWLVKRLRKHQGPLSRLDKKLVAIDLVPVANPDGIADNTRTNKKKVNLNRNFSHLWGLSKEYPGTHSFSEPETRSTRYLFENNKYTASVDVHGYINWIVAPTKPTLIQVENNKDLANRYNSWLTALKKQTKKFDPSYELKTAGGLGDGGAFEDWAFWNQGSLAFCLEMATAFRYQHNFNKATKKSVRKDVFIKYEKFIYDMFRHAIKITDDSKLIANN